MVRRARIEGKRRNEISANSVLIERKGNACFITLNRPDNFNALDLETAQALSTAVAQCHDEEVRAVVITGAGRAFCSGGDLGHLGAAPDLGDALGEVLFTSIGRSSTSACWASRWSPRSTGSPRGAAWDWRWPAICASSRKRPSSSRASPAPPWCLTPVGACSPVFKGR